MHHILVVDDDPTNTMLLTFLLQDEGYAVTAVHSAHEALATLDTNHYDLILLDIMLPGMNGLELCRRIRMTSTTPIIFLSARGNVADIVVGLRAGGDDYISKPVDPHELLARMWAILRHTRQLADTESNLKTPDLVLDRVNNTVTLARTRQTVTLTPTEARFLHSLLSNPGHSVTRDALAIKVWGGNIKGTMDLGPIIMRLRKKIEDDPDKPAMLLTVHGVGYKYQPSGTNA